MLRPAAEKDKGLAGETANNQAKEEFFSWDSLEKGVYTRVSGSELNELCSLTKSFCCQTARNGLAICDNCLRTRALLCFLPFSGEWESGWDHAAGPAKQAAD